LDVITGTRAQFVEKTEKVGTLAGKEGRKEGRKEE
jgi:hypothetical protein